MERYCSNCGRLIPIDSKICPYCSKKIDTNEIPIQPKISKKDDKTGVIIVVVIALILIITTIAIAATVYVYTSSMMGTPEVGGVPVISFMIDDMDNTLTVLSIDGVCLWSSISIVGEGNLPTGLVSQGDKITDCEGEITLYYKPADVLLGSYTFS